MKKWEQVRLGVFAILKSDPRNQENYLISGNSFTKNITALISLACVFSCMKLFLVKAKLTEDRENRVLAHSSVN